MNVRPEVLDELRLHLLVFHVQSVTHVVKLPPLLDFEVLGQFFPVVVDLFYQLEVGLDDGGHLAQVNRIFLHVLPEHEVAFQELADLALDLLEL